MDDRKLAEIQHNKTVRGYIMWSLVKGYNNTALTKQLSNFMIAAGLIVSPDTTKYLDYLKDAGYIEFTNLKVTAYNIYTKDAVIRLTRAGANLAEGTIEDAGVDAWWEGRGRRTAYPLRLTNCRLKPKDK